MRKTNVKIHELNKLLLKAMSKKTESKEKYLICQKRFSVPSSLISCRYFKFCLLSIYGEWLTK